MGLFGIKQFWFLGDYCVGMENTLAFLGLIILYSFILWFETELNLKEKKYNKKRFDKSGIYITIGLVILFVITQNLDSFKSHVELTAKTEKGFGHKLYLREGGDFDLIRHYVKTDCYYFGKYKWNKDTLEIEGKGQIDGRYYWDKTQAKLISKSGYYDNFNVEKTSP